jgi:hypothetical protein
LIKGLAGVEMVPRCKCQKSLEKSRILQTECNKTSEWVLVAIIYNEEFANPVIICERSQNFMNLLRSRDSYSNRYNIGKVDPGAKMMGLGD